MTTSPEQFAYWLDRAVYLIKAKERKNLSVIEDELAFALGRDKGGEPTIRYWRRGNVPADIQDLEQLATLLAQRGGLDRESCKHFLLAGGHPTPTTIVARLFPQMASATPRPPTARGLHPFVTNRPITEPSQFFGRTRECRRIFAWWRYYPLQNVAIVGPRRSGRTSLLRYLRAINVTPAGQLRPGQRNDWLPTAANYHWLYIDFFDARWRKRDNLLHHLLAELELESPNPCPLETFMEIASNGLSQPAIIMFDELSAALEMPDYDLEFWRSMRALATTATRGNLAFVITATDALQTLAAGYGKTSPFFNLFTAVHVGPLTAAEADELIASSPRPFAPEEREWVLAHSQEWPILVQALCQARLIALEEGSTDDAWKVDGLRQIERYGYLLNGATAS
ncbi:MAG TPA: ATP-binding protein [Promineifilum sp.]|nr:ATP-binding protein [Promineifilum sp.]